LRLQPQDRRSRAAKSLSREEALAAAQTAAQPNSHEPGNWNFLSEEANSQVRPNRWIGRHLGTQKLQSQRMRRTGSKLGCKRHIGNTQNFCSAGGMDALVPTSALQQHFL